MFVRDSDAAGRERERHVVAVARLLRLDRADVERARAFALHLVVLQRRAVGERHFGHGVREVHRVARRHVALDHRRLRVAGRR